MYISANEWRGGNTQRLNCSCLMGGVDFFQHFKQRSVVAYQAYPNKKILQEFSPFGPELPLKLPCRPLSPLLYSLSNLATTTVSS